jgi:dipeptidyl aminopeptidase/acylaminoacyl peptidase
VHSLDGELMVEKRLGLVTLDIPQPVRWLDLPSAARLPLKSPGKAPVASSKNEGSPNLPEGATLLASDARGLVWREATPTGLFLRSAGPNGGQSRDQLQLNAHLAGVDLGETRVIDYRSSDGVDLKALVLLPPGYRDGTRLPVITWVYGGYSVRDTDDYFADPYMSGLYNLRLYTARGYAVLIPSIPLKRDGSENHILRLVPTVVAGG